MKKKERRRRNPSDGKGGEENENGYWGKLKNSDIVVRKKRREKRPKQEEIVCFGLQIFNKQNRLGSGGLHPPDSEKALIVHGERDVAPLLESSTHPHDTFVIILANSLLHETKELRRRVLRRIMMFAWNALRKVRERRPRWNRCAVGGNALITYLESLL